MNQLKLRNYFVESYKGVYPPFPNKNKEEKVKEKISVNTILYISKKNENDFILKLNVKIHAQKAKSQKPLIYFESTIVGLFNRLDEKKSIKIMSKTIAKDVLYEKMYSMFSNIFKNSPVENFELPLKLK